MTKITVSDRNEAVYLVAVGMVVEPSPRTARTMDFLFEATDPLFEARRAYSLNTPVPVLSFIEAARQIGTIIHNYRNSGVML